MQSLNQNRCWCSLAGATFLARYMHLGASSCLHPPGVGRMHFKWMSKLDQMRKPPATLWPPPPCLWSFVREREREIYIIPSHLGLI